MYSEELDTRHKPRKWQLDALDAWSVAYRGVVSVVTGAGKTFFAMQCMLTFWKKYPNAKVLIVVPTVALMDQWRVALRNDLRLSDDDIDLIGGGARRIEGSRVTLGVMNSLRSVAGQMTCQGRWFLIVDECHRSASEANRKVLHGNYVATLGLSATPRRQYDDLFERVVSKILGPIIFRYEYEDALRDGIISDFELWNICVTPDELEQKQLDADNRAIYMERRRLNDVGVETSLRLRNLLMRRSRHSQQVNSRVLATIAFVERFRGSRGLIFHESIQSANLIASELARRQHRVRAYHSKLGAATRYLNLLLYVRGQIDILVACRALDEGLDVPRTEFGIICASTASIRQRIQRLGRVLRPHREKKLANVITMYVLPTEREALRLESQRLQGLAMVRWFEVT